MRTVFSIFGEKFFVKKIIDEMVYLQVGFVNFFNLRNFSSRKFKILSVKSQLKSESPHAKKISQSIKASKNLSYTTEIII
jgi:23S rRNA A1618 N6-methylase RlmF